MPRTKESFDQLHPCDFYTPAELLADDEMYTVYEIARLLQGLDPDAEIDEETESVLLDWAVPWVMNNADDLVVADPPEEGAPGYYGLRRGTDVPSGSEDDSPAETNPDAASE